MCSVQFNEISITGYNEGKSHKDYGSQNRCVYFLTLSYAPPIEWITIFNILWNERIKDASTSLFAQAVIDGQDLKLYCYCDDYLQLYLDRLKVDIFETNQRYLEVLENKESGEAKSQQLEDDRRSIRQALEALKL